MIFWHDFDMSGALLQVKMEVIFKKLNKGCIAEEGKQVIYVVCKIEYWRVVENNTGNVGL